MNSQSVEFNTEMKPRRRQPRRRSVGDIPTDQQERERIIAEAKWLKDLREERDALLQETSLVKDEFSAINSIPKRRPAPTRRMSTGDVPTKSYVMDEEQRRIKEDQWMKQLMDERNKMLQETALHLDSSKGHDTIVESEHYKYFSQGWISPGPR